MALHRERAGCRNTIQVHCDCVQCPGILRRERPCILVHTLVYLTVIGSNSMPTKNKSHRFFHIFHLFVSRFTCAKYCFVIHLKIKSQQKGEESECIMKRKLIKLCFQKLIKSISRIASVVWKKSSHPVKADFFWRKLESSMFHKTFKFGTLQDPTCRPTQKCFVL